MISLVLLLIPAFCGFAEDEVHMNNGKVFRGLVVEQSDSHVSVEMAIGIVTLKRSEVREIRIGTDSEVQRQQRVVANKYKDQINDLNKLARRAYEIRNSLMIARQGVPRSQESQKQRDRVYQLEMEYAQLLQEFESYRQYSGKTVVPAIYRAYKEIESKISKIEADIALENKILEGIIQKEALANQKVSDANTRLQTAVEEIETERDRLLNAGCPEQELAFAQKAISELSDGKSGPSRIPLMKNGNTYMLPVQLNRSVTDVFMLDTGASGILINKRLFHRLHLSRDKYIGNGLSTIANGQTIETEIWMIDEVRVNAFSVKNVKVIVLVDPAHDDIMPLLGGEFLNHFHYQIDPVGKNLILEPLNGRNN
ncbi:MAG: retroviral-like aspartic protease family protein [Opitutales bacterium]|nr:retroviral-like aspartic protease family protein [Opitutales bacterium]